MPDFKDLYLKLLRASEEALKVIEQAQEECEQMYADMEEKKEKTP